MLEEIKNNDKIIHYGQVGGGRNSFIGPVHRTAIEMNGNAKIVAGSFSRDYKETLKTAESLNISKDRAYQNFEEMAEKEFQRDDRIDFVVITTPNHLHYKAAKIFLEKGFNVVCDKPLCFTVEEAMELVNLTRKKDLEFMVTYTYTGYPMIREAKMLVKSEELGEIRIIMAEYPQDWLVDPIEKEGQKQAKWRTDPKYSGISCCVNDIGTHVENLMHFITDLKIKKLAANVETFVKGRSLDDNAYILLKYENGSSGSYWVSQVALGKVNNLKIRIFGTKGSLEWEQENPEILKFTKKGSPTQYLTKGRNYISDNIKNITRLPGGHPEGYFVAFSNLYKFYMDKLIAKKMGKKIEKMEVFPTVVDGARGVKFVHDCIKSSKNNSIWVDGGFEI
ncbi:MAG TPA: Gfo/Idh/MocA family oxidoreductase [Candidatus Atribacteria bacterium]|nr:Gfo/Idh/MocA family oxidoreductase [Candidatus Atribacteria bacterium]